MVDKLRKFYEAADCCRIRAIRTYTSLDEGWLGYTIEDMVALASVPLPRIDEYAAPFIIAVGVALAWHRRIEAGAGDGFGYRSKTWLWMVPHWASIFA